MKKKTSVQNKKKNIGLIVFIAIFSLLYVFGIFAVLKGCNDIKKNFKKSYNELEYNYNEITSNPSDLGFDDKKDKGIINIALFGIDTKNPKSYSGRSDSIMILSINKATNKVKLISVLRDSFVPIERDWGTQYTKINSAYAAGGPELAIKTLNQIFALDISEYATVNFNGMAEIIDVMGGVEVEVTEAEIPHINSASNEQFRKNGIDPVPYTITKSGKQKLCGIQAVSYSRIRYVANASGTNNDYGRTDRQRYVLTQLFNAAKSKTEAEYVKLIKALSPHCQTSLTHSEILEIALDVLMDSPKLEETRMPSVNYGMKRPNTNAGAVNYYDLNFAANIIHAFIYEDIKPETFVELTGIEKNDWYAKGYEKPEIISYKERKEAKEKENAAQSNTTSAE